MNIFELQEHKTSEKYPQIIQQLIDTSETDLQLSIKQLQDISEFISKSGEGENVFLSFCILTFLR
jgi:hypothetical protein